MRDENIENENNNPDKDSKNYYLSYVIGFGLLAGVLIAVLVGIFTDTRIWAFAPGFGMLVGMFIGIALDKYEINNK